MKQKILKTVCIFTVIVLISSVWYSSLLVNNVWGRFFSQSEAGDRARTAKWNVTAEVLDAQEFDFSLTPVSPDATYSFTVTSNSEVAVEYDVIMTLQAPLTDPDCISFTLTDTTNNRDIPSTTENGLVYTFSSAGSFSADGGTIEHILTITANDFINSISQTGISVQIDARQID